jgi:predicted transcriptional regulator YheO
MNLSNYIPLCDAIVTLMNPLVEIAIHDLDSGKICYINGGISKRKPGDLSLLNKRELEINIDKIVYPKINFDGHLIKSISVPIKDKWLICINCDVSIFNQMQLLSEQFLHSAKANKPNSLFKNDWQEKLHIAIHKFLNEKGWSFEQLGSFQKKELIRFLFDSGAFGEKNAADYLANVLAIGRATIFKYLKEWRQNDN